jgi:PIN domain nuclease of toxin-antitoxin system
MGSDALIDVLFLDTQTMVWLVEGIDRLGRRSRRMIDRSMAQAGVAVATVCFWEITLLVGKRRLVLDVPMEQWRLRVLGLGIQEIALTGDMAIAAAQLDGFHADPADRIIAATAHLLDGTLVTADQRILEWKGSLRRQDATV